MGQLFPGNTVRFNVVTREMALKALREQERTLDSLRDVPTVSSIVKVAEERIDVVDGAGELYPFDAVGNRFNASVRHNDHVENLEINIED